MPFRVEELMSGDVGSTLGASGSMDQHQTKEWATQACRFSLGVVQAGVANRQAVQHSAVMGLECSGGNTIRLGASRLRGSAPPEELSFPPDARLKWAMDCMSRW